MVAKLHGANVKLSKAQMMKLAKGEKVRLSVAGLSGNNHVMLTKTQHNKLEKCRREHKGMDLILSKTALSGSGFMDSIKNASNWVYNNALKPAGQMVFNQVLKDPKGSFDMAKKLLGALTGGKVNNKEAMQFHNHMTRLHGGSFFGDIGDFFTKTIPQTFSSPSGALGALGTAASFIPVVGEVLGPALAVSSIGAKLAGHGVKKGKKGGDTITYIPPLSQQQLQQLGYNPNLHKSGGSVFGDKINDHFGMVPFYDMGMGHKNLDSWGQLQDKSLDKDGNPRNGLPINGSGAKKGSAEMKAKMANLRAMKGGCAIGRCPTLDGPKFNAPKFGGSFKPAGGYGV